MGQAERITVLELAMMTGKTVRALQAMASSGKIPSAGKIGREWTFDRATVRRWIKAAESRACQITYTRGTGSGGSKFRWPERSTDEACARALGL